MHIPGYDNYIASTEGRIANLETRSILCGNKGKHSVEVSIKPSELNKPNKRGIHLLVAEAFLGPKPSESHHINHIDGDHTNRRPKNLVWSISKARKTTTKSQIPVKRKREQEPKTIIEKEIWKRVPDSFMQVEDTKVEISASNLGRIRQGDKIKSQFTNHGGYKMVSVHGSNIFVHRLVAAAFLPNPDSLPQIDHIDGNPENNNVSNLQWISVADHATKTSGKEVFQFELSGKFIKSFKSVKIAADESKISEASIARAARGERTHYKDYIWSFFMVSEPEDLEYVTKQTQIKKLKIDHESKTVPKIDLTLLEDKEYNALNEKIKERAELCGVEPAYVRSISRGQQPLRLPKGTKFTPLPNDDLYIQKIANKTLNEPKILKYSIHGVFIKKFDNIDEASQSTDCSPDTIRKCCRVEKHHLIVGSFVWRYLVDGLQDPSI